MILRVVRYTQPSMISETWRKGNRTYIRTTMSCSYVQHRFVWVRLGEGSGWIRYQSPCYNQVFLTKVWCILIQRPRMPPLGAITYAAMSNLPVAHWVGSIPDCYSQAIWSRDEGWAHRIGWPDSCCSLLASSPSLLHWGHEPKWGRPHEAACLLLVTSIWATKNLRSSFFFCCVPWEPQGPLRLFQL